MKVCVITRHAINNYGSFLQAYATQEVLQQHGFTCEIIDYIRTDEEYRNIDKTELCLKPEWNHSGIKRVAYRIIREPESRLTGKRFESYRNRYLKMTKRYSSGQDLNSNPPQADCYLTGSDQVWGPIGLEQYDDVYFLSFVNDGSPKLSYAASFGRTCKDTVIYDHFKKLLQNYSKILVREDSAVEQIESMGLSAKQVLDPTLLLSRDYWLSRIQKMVQRGTIPQKGYVLVYQIHKNELLSKYASELAKKYRLKLIRVSPSLHQISRGGRFVYCPDPFVFLSLINSAACMVTDSFHGTVLAINLNTQFVEVLPQNDTNTRNVSILKLMGLSNRILEKQDDYKLYERRIDYDKVNTVLSDERDKSNSILKDMLDNVTRVA